MRTTTDCGFRDSKDISAQDSLLKFGPTLKVDIGLDLDFLSAGSGEPDLPRKGLFALVDTGASECFIDSFLADSLKLQSLADRMYREFTGLERLTGILPRFTFLPCET